METNRVVVKKEQPVVRPVFSPEAAGEFPGYERLIPPSLMPLPQAYEPSIHCAMNMALKTEMSMSYLFETHEPLRKHQIPNSNTEAENAIDAIKAKHGNIDKNCIMKSERLRKLNLVFICDLLKELQEKKLEELDVPTLEHYYEVVRDIEKLNIKVKWLLQRLDEIKDAIASRDEVKGFTDEKEEHMNEMEEKRREVERLNSEIRILEGVVERLDNSISNRTTTFEKFQNRPLMEGLM